MTFIKKVGGIPMGIFFSILIHAGFGGGFHSLFTFGPLPPIVAELDLSMTSFLPAAPPPPPPPPPPGPPAGSAPSAEAIPGPTRAVVKKQAAAFSFAKKETPQEPERMEVSESPIQEADPFLPDGISSGEVQETDEGASATEDVAGAGSGEPGGVPGGIPGGQPGGAPEGVPGGVIGGVPGGELGGVLGGQLGGVLGGSLGGTGRYLSASQVAQPPRWIGNLMTPRDYPPAARRKGKDGRVVMSVFIDETGRVREVRLLQGSDDILNEVALRKVREALFTPAYSQEGQPVACKVILPIRFQLQ